MLDQLREGDVVVISRLDRLARSTRDLLELCEEIGTVGAGLKSLAVPWADTTSAAGKMILTVFGGITEFERSLIRERTGTDRKAAMIRGMKFGRPAKLNAEQIALVTRLADEGQTAPQIAETFGVHERPPVKTTRFATAAVLAIVVGVGAYLGFGAMSDSVRAPNVGYTLLDGRKSTTDELRGKVVLVNFWSTDCTTCVKEMPNIAATHEKYKARGYETLAVAMSFDPPAQVINFAETRKLPFGVAIDNTGEIAKRFGQVQVTPTSVLINKRGQIVKRYVGEPDFAALHRLVEKLLAET